MYSNYQAYPSYIVTYNDVLGMDVGTDVLFVCVLAEPTELLRRSTLKATPPTSRFVKGVVKFSAVVFVALCVIGFVVYYELPWFQTWCQWVRL